MRSKDPSKESTFRIRFRWYSWSNRENMNNSICPSLVFLSFLLLLFTNGVSGDETKDMLVTEGDSVTLDTGVEKQKDDLIVWSFGPENIIVAKINGKAGSSRIYGRITSRGKLDLQTGSLTITNTSITDSGLYNLKINCKNRVSYKTFNVAVQGSETVQDSIIIQIENLDIDERCQTSPCLGTTRLPMFLIVATPFVVFCLILILLVVVCYMKHTRGYEKAPLMKAGHPEEHKIQEQV